jgi:hypothetical protein
MQWSYSWGQYFLIQAQFHTKLKVYYQMLTLQAIQIQRNCTYT